MTNIELLKEQLRDLPNIHFVDGHCCGLDDGLPHCMEAVYSDGPPPVRSAESDVLQVYCREWAFRETHVTSKLACGLSHRTVEQAVEKIRAQYDKHLARQRDELLLQREMAL